VDRTCGVTVVVDPQDGALLSFTAPVQPPPVEPPPTRTIKVEQAYFTAFGRTMGPTGPQVESELGYAVPKGGSRAVLCWRLKNGKLVRLIHASENRRVKDIVYR
jgi:hypothetical protein